MADPELEARLRRLADGARRPAAAAIIVRHRRQVRRRWALAAVAVVVVTSGAALALRVKPPESSGPTTIAADPASAPSTIVPGADASQDASTADEDGPATQPSWHWVGDAPEQLYRGLAAALVHPPERSIGITKRRGAVVVTGGPMPAEVDAALAAYPLVTAESHPDGQLIVTAWAQVGH